MTKIGSYAQSTSVPVAKTESEIRQLLIAAGCKETAVFNSERSAAIAFVLPNDGKRLGVRITLPLPDIAKFRATPTGKARTDASARSAWEGECRSSWRALYLLIRAKLEAVERGISTLEREFFPDVMLPGGMTVETQLGGDLSRILSDGKPIRLLPA